VLLLDALEELLALLLLLVLLLDALLLVLLLDVLLLLDVVAPPEPPVPPVPPEPPVALELVLIDVVGLVVPDVDDSLDVDEDSLVVVPSVSPKPVPVAQLASAAAIDAEADVAIKSRDRREEKRATGRWYQQSIRGAPIPFRHLRRRGRSPFGSQSGCATCVSHRGSWRCDIHVPWKDGPTLV
jgi:hypothetical protein